MSEIIKQEQPVSLITQAISAGANIETLEKLMALQERYEANQARKAFFEALSEFQRKCPVLKKNKKVSFKSEKTGFTTNYNYTPLAQIVSQVKNILSDCGLTYRWETKDDGNNIVITCIITHKDGHSESNSMSAQSDTSGSKNVIQGRGSAVSYLQRYTLIGALGISSADEDTDGRIIEKSIDELHKEFIALINPLIQKDSEKYSKYLPENWKKDITAENYLKAIAELKKIK